MTPDTVAHPSPRLRPHLARILAIALTLVTALSGLGASAVGAQGEPPMRGMNVLFYGYDASEPKLIDGLLDNLAQMHVNTIILDVPIFIDSLYGNQIEAVYDGSDQHIYGDTPHSAEMQAFIKPALARGFTIWVRPLLDEQSLFAEDPNTWRGRLQPSDPALFFANYTRTLKDLSDGAAGASWFVIGTELASLQAPQYDDAWSALIDEMRTWPTTQAMKLIYATPWDTEGNPQMTPWMDALDGVALDAYYPLDGLGNDASAGDVSDAWWPWASSLQAFRDRFPGKPFFLSEAGIASQDRETSAYQMPSQWPATDTPADTGIQSTYIAGSCAFLRNLAANDGSRMVDGVAWWFTSVNVVKDPEQDNSFYIVGKPAQQAVTDCFAAWTE